MNKKLIEVALPLEKINAESAREKSIRHGHPSTLHLWWARRPLAAARAVIWSSLVDDPSSHPELFPTEEDQNKERQRLFGILEDLVVWENSNDETVLSKARAEIMKSTGNNPPALLDPFAGGGAIPLEAQRLGLEAHAHDLNPVAVMINKAMIEIPPRFANKAPVNPDSRRMGDTGWTGASGLAEDVRYYGEWMKQEAFKRIGHLYPKVKVPQSQGGGEATVIAWIWARTVKCPNPICGKTVPLMKSFWLSKSKGKEAYVLPTIKNDELAFLVNNHVPESDERKIVDAGTKYKNTDRSIKGNFFCPWCESGAIKGDYADELAAKGKMGVIPVAIVAETKHGRAYLPVDDIQYSTTLRSVDNYYISHDILNRVPSEPCYGTGGSNARGRRYSFFEFKDYFTKRQQICLTELSELIPVVQKRIEEDAVSSCLKCDHIHFSDGGNGALAYSEAICTYLGFMIDKLADANSSLVSWNVSRDGLRNTFARQAYPMTWDFAEGNPFSSSSGCIDNCFDWIIRCLQLLPAQGKAFALQQDAQTDCGIRNVLVSTDPPYYDNIGYADLSDYFYVWLRKSLSTFFPDVFKTMLVPKAEELVAIPYRFDGDKRRAHAFFEEGMYQACKQFSNYSGESYPVTIYYAYKQNETDVVDKSGERASSGWETMLSAIIRAGLSVTGTWPISTERESRSVSIGTNALASSIVLVCRKRDSNAGICTRRNFVNELKRELRPALKKLQSSNIAPVDLQQSAIGPGMGVFSKYAQVLEADGTPMSVRSALKIINQELDLYFNEQDSEIDNESRFCVELYSMVAFNDMKFGDANTLANAKGTSVASMASHGTLYAQKGVVHLIERSELSEKIDEHESNIWKLCQQLSYRMEKEGIEGCAKAVANMFGTNAERAKDLAYRLYTIAERKKWAAEALVYNNLVVSWPEIQSRAAELKAVQPEQLTIFDN